MKIRDYIALTTNKNEDGIFPISFPEFTISWAAILVQCANHLIATDFPAVTAKGESLGGGNGKSDAGVYDYVRVFAGVDMMRYASMFRQVSGFLCWLLEQEVDDRDDTTCWFQYDFLCEKWNEYGRIQQQTENRDGEQQWED